jgi:hypothetical protein
MMTQQHITLGYSTLLESRLCLRRCWLLLIFTICSARFALQYSYIHSAAVDAGCSIAMMLSSCSAVTLPSAYSSLLSTSLIACNCVVNTDMKHICRVTSN